ncbi:MAG TPA: rod shape-determining protein [Thermoleophilaceae bacterium]|nr:rod shape-determining protein [Thermoleophilaceae bacterium]
MNVFLRRLTRADRDIAIDLGTANTLVYEPGRGIVLSEPSVVAMNEQTGAVEAVGFEASRMIGRTPATISATRPLRHGVIADFEVTEQMLRHFLRKVEGSRIARPRVVMCAPSGITEVERRAVEEACYEAGARKVQLIEEPLAGAIGSDLPIEDPTGHMVVDVGGGTTEVAVLSLGGMAVSASVRVGGYDLDEAILAHLRSTYRLAVGSGRGEELKIELGSAGALEHEGEAQVRGRDLAAGLPTTVTLRSQEAREALQEPLGHILAAIHDTLERTPPELAADVFRDGITLFGGGSLLRGFPERVSAETGLATRLAESPLTCVAEGAGRSLAEFETLERTARAR